MITRKALAALILTGTTFWWGSAASGQGHDEAEPTGSAAETEAAAAQPASLFATDDAFSDEDSLFDDSPISLLQAADEPPPSELGAVPGQHIRPRRTDE